MPAAAFIALAEDTGLIHRIGEWVIETVCAQWRAWLDAGLDVPLVAVGLAAQQFRREDLVPTIGRALAAHRLEPRRPELEVSEGTVMHDMAAASAILGRLKAFGLRIALDDFGSGHLPSGPLRRVPIDRLKIGPTFVHGSTSDPVDAAICHAIIALAHHLQLAVVAEGVETEAQMNHLRRRHCDGVQGQLFSRPLPANEFARLLADGNRLALPAAEHRQRKLLLVDDEENIVAALKRLLRRDGSASSARTTQPRGCSGWPRPRWT